MKKNQDDADLEKFLGVPPSRQPLTMYGMLGLENFEPDIELIRRRVQELQLHLAQFTDPADAKKAAVYEHNITTIASLLTDPEFKEDHDKNLRMMEEAVGGETVRTQGGWGRTK